MPHSTALAWEPRTRRFLIAAAILAALAAAILTAPPVALSSERFELGSPAGAVWNLAGHTRIEGGTGKAIVVLADRGGRDASRLTFSTDPIGGEAALRVDYPDAHVVYPKLGLW